MIIKEFNQLIWETYAHGTSKDLLWRKEETKCNNVIKTIQKCLTLIILQKKT